MQSQGKKSTGFTDSARTLRPASHIHNIPREKYCTLGHETSIWLDDIIVVTRGTKEQHPENLESVVTKLENEGYKASKKKIEVLFKRNSMAGTHHRSRRNQAKQRNNRSNKQTKPTDKYKNTEIFPGDNSSLCKICAELIRENR